MNAMSGWDVTEWAIACTAVIAAGAAIWKAAGAIRDIREGVDFVQMMMKPNGGSSIIDRLNRLEDSVRMLLIDNAREDVPGKRYGPEHDEETHNGT